MYRTSLQIVLFAYLLFALLYSLQADEQRVDAVSDSTELVRLQALVLGELETKPRSAKLHADSALQLAIALKDSIAIVDVSHMLSRIVNRRGKLDEAYEYAQTAATIAEEIGYLDGSSKAFEAIAFVHYKLRENEKALEADLQSLDYARLAGNEQREASVLHNLAVSYEEIGEFDTALEYAFKALELRTRIGTALEPAYTKGIIGVIYRKLGDSEKALKFLHEAREIIEREEDRYGSIYAYMDIGIAYADLHDYTASLRYLLDGLQVAKELGAHSEIAFVYQNLSLTAERMGQHREALQYYKNYKIYNDSLQTTNTAIQEKLVEKVKEQKKSEIDLLRQQQELRLSRANQQLLFRNFLMAGIILIGVIAALIYNLYRIKRNAVESEQQKNEELRHVNDALKDEIVEKERFADAHRESEMMLNLVMNNIPQAIFWKDRYLTFMGANQTFAENAGLESGEEVVGKTDFDLELEPGDAESFREADLRVIETGKPEHHLIYTPIINNRTVWLDTNKIPLLNKDGKIVGVLGTYEDITERVKAEEELARERENLSVTLTSISDGVITTDITGNIKLLNRVAEELTGWDQEAALGRILGDILIVVDERNRTTIQSPVDQVLMKREVVEITEDVVMISRNGSETAVELSAAPIMDRDQKVQGVVLAFRDITVRRLQKEEMLKTQKLESVGILAGGIAHDFNNILTGIMANISFARNIKNSDRHPEERLEEAEKACLRAKDLTQQLLTFARGGAPVKQLTPMKKLARSSIQFALRGSKVTASINIADDLQAADVDEGQINQVFHNLVINAIQAMPGGGMLDISGENVTIEDSNPLPLESGNYVSIRIKDHGVGIPRDYLEKIFDPYFTTKQSGSGLGLATCYSIVKNHDGLITVESEPGKGTRFTVYLPSTSESVEELPPINVDDLDASGRILVMDDDESIVEIVERMLEEIGFDVEGANNGQQAIDLFAQAQQEEEPFDLVILDLTIPNGLGGRETMIELKKLDPKVRAVVSSGYSNDPVMANFDEYGFDGYLAKPFNMEGLRAIIRNLIVNGNGTT